MTLSEYARHRSCSAQAVEEAILAGRILRDEESGQIDPELADAMWHLSSNPRSGGPKKKRDNAVDLAAGAKRVATAAEVRRQYAEFLDVEKLGKLPLADARALKENFEAKLKFVELQKAEGQLLDRDAVLRDVEKICRVTRDHLLNIPRRIAGQVMSLSELSDVEATIEEEISTALEELADSLKRLGEGNPQ